MGIIMDKIVVSGPVIIEKGKLLVIKEDKDFFYKLPGGKKQNAETLAGTSTRGAKEEINAEIEVLKKLSTLILNKNPKTGDPMIMELHHFLSHLKNPKEIKPILPIKEIRWLDIKEIKEGRHYVGPNINFLVNKGEIK